MIPLARRLAPVLRSSRRQCIRFNSSNVPSNKGDSDTTPANRTEYVPKQVYQRVTYEYPPPPDQQPFKPVEGSAFRKHIPLLAAVGGVVWAAYAYKHFIQGDDSGGEEQSHLDPAHFTTFKLTYKENITEDLALIELAPKYETFQKFIRQKGGLWNGKKLWSVDVKQPEIQVVRKYTPLPLYYQQYYDGDKQKALLRIIGSNEDEGRIMLLVKRYNDGEVSRYLHKLPVGSEVDIRGPFVGYKFPYAPIDSTEPRDPMEDLPSRMLPEYAHPKGIPLPDNVSFFAGGTGIAPILQSLLSPNNPPRGRVDVYYSVRNESEIPISRFLLFLEKTGRARFHYFVDSENKFLSLKDVPEPIPKQYVKNLDPELDKDIEYELKLKKAMEEIRREKYGINESNTESAGTETETETLATATTAQVPVSTPPAPAPAQPNASSIQQEVHDSIGPRRKYRSVLEQVADSPADTRGTAIAVVCGPEGYINYVAGPRGPNNNAPIGGLLGKKNWTNENTFRMEA